MSTLRSKVPEIYHAFFPDFLDWEVPDEKIATCHNCTFCQSPQSPYLNTKCCAYHPQLANYLVGGILQDESPAQAEGKKRIRERIGTKIGVTPYGILPPTTFKVKFRALRNQQRLSTRGENDSLLCPYYDDGKCTVWKYRENLCATFFCVSTGGRGGQQFWDQLNGYLKMAETELSKYAMLKIGFPPKDIRIERPKSDKLLVDDEAGIFHSDRYENLWGSWLGKEEEFFRSCYEVISRMDRATFLQLTGLSQEILQQGLDDTFRQFTSFVFPDYLKLHPEVQISSTDDGHVELSILDVSHRVPAVFLPLLKAFNGERNTTEVYHLAYRAFVLMGDVVEDLLRKGILFDADPSHP